jgi:sensor c-di-GMP phosphodiesterase-like protein
MKTINSFISRILISKISIFIILGFGFFLSFLTTQAIYYLAINEKVHHQTHLALELADTIAIHQIDVIKDIHGSVTSKCTNSDLIKLKKITFTNQYIKDAGKIVDNVIVCTALWGDVHKSIKLEKGRLTKNGFIIWDGIDKLEYYSSRVDIVSNKSSFIVTAPDVFSSITRIADDILIEITNYKGNKTLHSFGQIEKASLWSVSERKCSKFFDICTTGKMNASFINDKNKLFIYLACFFACIISFILHLFIERLRLKYFSLGSKLSRAINNDEVEVFYQPILHISTKLVVGFEALARWNDSHYGPVAPDIFIKVAKDNNIYFEFNKFIISKALRDFNDILSANRTMYLSLNVDGGLFINNDFYSYFKYLIKLYEINPKQIAIEILEDSYVGHETLPILVDRIRSVGCRIFIDDFGMGYSNLSYLSTIHVDSVKIDKSLTQSAGTKSPASIILLKIIEIVDLLNIVPVFEGIETLHQEKIIIQMFPNALGQGWLYSKAISKEKVLIYLLDQNGEDSL